MNTYLQPETTTFFGRFENKQFYWSFEKNTVVLSCSHFIREKFGRIRFHTFLYGLHTACIQSWFKKIFGRFQKYTVVYGRIQFHKSTA